jgi:hypothetical protein
MEKTFGLFEGYSMSFNNLTIKNNDFIYVLSSSLKRKTINDNLEPKFMIFKSFKSKNTPQQKTISKP